MRRVLHIGPCETPGGMAKVMHILAENPPDGWEAEMISSHSVSGIFRKIMVWRKVRAFLKENKSKFDVVHIHSAAGFSYRRKLNLAKLAKKLGIPTIIHIHSGQFDKMAEKRKSIEKELLPFTVVVLNKYWENRLQPIIGKCSVVSNPIDPKIEIGDFEKRKTKQLLLLGRADPVKGHDFAFKIAREIRNNGWELFATGTEHSEEGITGLGWISEERKYELLKDSTALLIPSQFEGQPMVMYEAIKSGCQIVASQNINEIPDCVYSAPHNDLQSWIEIIEEIEPLRENNISELHSIDKINEKWLELYSKTINDYNSSNE